MLKELTRGIKFFKTPIPEGKKVAIVDIDDVLYPCTEVLLNHFNKSYSTDHEFTSNANFNIEKLFKEIESKKHLISLMINDVDYMCISPFYSYAKHLIDSLVEKDYYIAVVTARGFHPKGYLKSFQMFQQHGLHFDAMATIKIGQSKLDFVLEHVHNEPDLLLEDNVLVMEEFHEYGTKVVKFEKPWNIKCSDHSHIVRPQDPMGDIHNLLEAL